MKRIPPYSSDDLMPDCFALTKEGLLAEDIFITFCALQLCIPSGSHIEPVGNAGGWHIIPGNPGSRAITFGPSADRKEFGLKSQRLHLISGEDPKTVRLLFEHSLHSSLLDASIRYFIPTASSSQKTGVAPSKPTSLNYSIFNKSTSKQVCFKTELNLNAQGELTEGTLTLTEDNTFRSNFLSTVGEALNISIIPDHSQIVSQWDPVQESAYSTLKGDWLIGAPKSQSRITMNADDLDVMFGLSGIEFGKVSDGSIIRFVPGSPAYAKDFPGKCGLTSECPGSEYPVTTSWVYFQEKENGPKGLFDPAFPSASTTSPDAPCGYYSQPQTAGLYTAEEGGSFLEVMMLRAGMFPAGATGVLGAPAASFPMVSYLGISEIDGTGSLEIFHKFEIEVLTPIRTDAIIAMNKNSKVGPICLALPSSLNKAPFGYSGPTGPTGPTGPIRLAVTPQGMLSAFTQESVKWQSLLLASTEQGNQTLQITDIHDKLQWALLTNQLFLVVSTPDELLKYCSVMYLVTDQVLADFAILHNIEGKVPPKELLAIAAKLAGRVFFDKKCFEEIVEKAFGEEYSSWVELFVPLAEMAELAISGWKFNLTPHRWDEKTILIFKFADKSMESLINDLSLWTMATDFNSDPKGVKIKLQTIMKDAQKRAKTEPEFTYFADTVLSNKRSGGGKEIWNGIIFLDTYVPATDFPPQLRGLAFGIDQKKFRAHHIGINLAPVDVQDGVIQVGDSSLFGLIDYSDKEDLIYKNNPYEFKVLSMRILFANSQIASFEKPNRIIAGRTFRTKVDLARQQSRQQHNPQRYLAKTRQ